METSEVICAVSTAPGIGAIAVLRMSGTGCIALTDRIFESPSGKKLTGAKANTVHFGRILEEGCLLDEVLVTIFHAPHSFTGEESVEIACHGSLYIQQRLLQLLVNQGARLATPGEFTQRAFLNGKMDLSQAEAVADLIASSSAASHRMALKQMKGGFSAELMKLRAELLHITSLLELELDFSEEAFQRVEERLNLINHLKSKYGKTTEHILKEKQAKEEKLDQLQHYEEYRTELEETLRKTEAALQHCCETVTEIRKKYAKELADQTRQALLELNFLDVQFEMKFGRLDHYTANGLDETRFMISTNPGEPLKPLDAVASGGELSRIMLAIKTVLADTDDIPTLIFDEIDTGISGRTAQKVSERLSYIGKKHQVLCITHLPQIAAMADTHFEIKKSVENGVTATKIRKLTEKDEVDELARLLGGAEITEKVRENAEEMKRLAEETKNHRAVLQTAG